MLYWLFDYLQQFNFPGARLFDYISFRTAAASFTSVLISVIYGKRIIKFLQKRQIGENVRDLGLEGQYQKKGTPTMGGIIIIAAIVIPTLLFAKLDNIYIILMLITTVWLGIIGFIDDYIKVFKKNKAGLSGKFKIYGQVGLGLLVGIVFYMNDDIQIIEDPKSKALCDTVQNLSIDANQVLSKHEKPLKTTIPFIKDNEFDYSYVVGFIDNNREKWAWFIFIILVIVIITAVSNGANLTDGLDGLATGTSAIMGSTLGVFAYVSGNIIFADYLNIMYIPNVGELVIFAGIFVGATVGFLWYNQFPAQVFMGDTGSLTLGGIIAVFAILVHKELLIPVLCGIFFVENLSVVLQVSYFKYTKKRFGEGRRIFLMSPLHHHFQKKGIPEPKIVTRFWIIAILLAISTIITLKIR